MNIATEGNIFVGTARDDLNDRTKEVSYLYKIDASTGKMIYKKYLDQLSIGANGGNGGNHFISALLTYYQRDTYLQIGHGWKDRYIVKIDPSSDITTKGKTLRSDGWQGDFIFIGKDMYTVATSEFRKVENFID